MLDENQQITLNLSMNQEKLNCIFHGIICLNQIKPEKDYFKLYLILKHRLFQNIINPLMVFILKSKKKD